MPALKTSNTLPKEIHNTADIMAISNFSPISFLTDLSHGVVAGAIDSFLIEIQYLIAQTSKLLSFPIFPVIRDLMDR